METLWACVCASFLLGNMGWRKQSRVHTTKEIKQNLLWGLYTLRPRIQILRGSLFQKKSYKRDIMKRFSADATIFLFCPWKREKNALKNAHIWPHFFFKTALSRPYGQKLKILIGNWAPAPSVIHTLWCTQLASEMMILHFFPPLIDAFFELMKSSSTTTITYLTSSYLLRKGFDFLFSKMKSIFSEKSLISCFQKWKPITFSRKLLTSDP